MELPTYTNIWKIEKRLYKLYDFRLPMPLPVGQVAAFLAIAIPYMLILTLVGMPFSHTWVWLYVLPPGALAWLVTRPVLEGKRLPELVLSQVRYLTEPRTWCRLVPLSETDRVIVVAQVWRAPAGLARKASSAAEEPATELPGDDAVAARPAWPDLPAVPARGAAPAGQIRVAVAGTDPPAARVRLAARAAQAGAAQATARAPVAPVAPGADRDLVTSAGTAVASGEVTPVADTGVSSSRETAAATAADSDTAARAADVAGPAWAVSGRAAVADADVSAVASAAVARTASERAAVVDASTAPAADLDGPARAVRGQAGADADPRTAAGAGPATGSAIEGPAAGARTEPAQPTQATRPVLTVRASVRSDRPLQSVERALRTSTGDWRGRVVVVPGGHRPGKPDHVQRDRARARQPLPGPARIVVLGSTGGAGQTVTTLLTGQLLASLRGEAVAVLDFGGPAGSLTELAREVPRLLPGKLAGAQDTANRARPGRARGLQVVTADHTGLMPRDAGRLIDTVVARYSLTLADPSAADVPRALHVADQLVLVTPASANAASSLAMTLEWLEAHGHGRLADAAVTVLNGVSDQTVEHAERAAGVAAGRCRAIVQVPWDTRLPGGGALAAATVYAYTALAGALISGLADPVVAASSGAGSAGR